VSSSFTATVLGNAVLELGWIYLGFQFQGLFDLELGTIPDMLLDLMVVVLV